MTDDAMPPLPDGWEESRFPTPPFVARLGAMLLERGWVHLPASGAGRGAGWEFGLPRAERGMQSDPPRIVSIGSSLFEVTVMEARASYRREFDLETIAFLLPRIEQSDGEAVSVYVDAPYDDELDAILVDRGWTSMRRVKDELYFDEWHWRPSAHPHPGEPTTIFCQQHDRFQVNLCSATWAPGSESYNISRAQLLASLDRIEAHG